MPSVYGGPLTTFEDAEKESEYGYVRKVLPLPFFCYPSVSHFLLGFFIILVTASRYSDASLSSLLDFVLCICVTYYVYILPIDLLSYRNLLDFVFSGVETISS